MADLTKTEEQEVEKSLDEEVEKTPRTLEADSGVGGEGNSSTSGTVHSTAEEENEVDSGNQDDRAKRKTSDPEDEPPKKAVSIIYFELRPSTCFEALAQEKIESICAKHIRTSMRHQMSKFVGGFLAKQQVQELYWA